MIDVHAHFAEEGYEFPAEWDKIKEAGVKAVILAADTLEHAAWHAKFCEEHEGAFFTVGMHPEFAEREINSAQFCTLAAHKKCVGVGEIGLDYHYGTEGKEAQKKRFEMQIEAADYLDLPVEIHSRDACADTLAILRAHKGQLSHGFVMHCYSYGAENLAAFADLGAYFSFGGVLCFKNARRAAEAAAACPSDRILLETDSPYLSPFRGEKNTPANLPVIEERLACIRGWGRVYTDGATDRNAKSLFPALKLL